MNDLEKNYIHNKCERLCMTLFRSSYILSNSTIIRIMKRDLKISNHLLDKKQIKVVQEDEIKKSIQVFTIQIQ